LKDPDIRVSGSAGSAVKLQQRVRMRHIKHKRTSDFRIESNRTLKSPHWAMLGGEPASNEIMVHDRSLAVAMAAKTRTVFLNPNQVPFP
jgi:hypothetical protein